MAATATVTAIVSWVLVSALIVPGGRHGLDQGQAPVISYETFCALPGVEAKRAAFLATTPDNRAQLVRTQIERWRALHRARLSNEQRALLADILSIVTPESGLYGGGQQAEGTRELARALAVRQRELFPRDDRQTMEPNGPCLPPVKTPRP